MWDAPGFEWVYAHGASTQQLSPMTKAFGYSMNKRCNFVLRFLGAKMELRFKLIELASTRIDQKHKKRKKNNHKWIQHCMTITTTIKTETKKNKMKWKRLWEKRRKREREPMKNKNSIDTQKLMLSIMIKSNKNTAIWSMRKVFRAKSNRGKQRKRRRWKHTHTPSGGDCRKQNCH